MEHLLRMAVPFIGAPHVRAAGFEAHRTRLVQANHKEHDGQKNTDCNAFEHAEPHKGSHDSEEDGRVHGLVDSEGPHQVPLDEGISNVCEERSVDKDGYLLQGSYSCEPEHDEASCSHKATSRVRGAELRSEVRVREGPVEGAAAREGAGHTYTAQLDELNICVNVPLEDGRESTGLDRQLEHAKDHRCEHVRVAVGHHRPVNGFSPSFRPAKGGDGPKPRSGRHDGISPVK
mmetsp:Transcript_13776/g.40263  ORF Transcript_13776/g.40263 Transcript_13776/m.40263 type:complete len:232 (-) Transcript_13776:324-1019(-)